MTVALAGNPNSGKTTLFNALTGLRQKVANYPGVTVEKKVGRCKLPDLRWCDVIDLPGTYSLISRSPDETVAMEVLRGIRADVRQPDVVVVVVDASNLQRNLYLVSQLVELGRPLVVALNMMDIAQRRGIRVSADALSEELGVPVIPVVGYKRKGIAELKQAILKASVAPMPNWALPEAMREELLVVGGGLAILDSEDESRKVGATLPRGTGVPPVRTAQHGRDAARLSSSKSHATAEDLSPIPPRAWICQGDVNRRLDRYEALAERLLIGDRAADIARLAAQEPVSSLLSQATGRLNQLGIDPMQADVEAHYRWIESVAQKVISDAEPAGFDEADRIIPYARPKPVNLTQKVDQVLCHKVWGLAIFALIMGLMFVALFWLAQPIMDAIQNGIKALGVLVTSHLSEGPIKALLRDGIFNGVGAVVVFVPQIALLFLFLSLLEDSGYLARAAFLMDRLLSKVGLHGKSFIPLLSSFACAIPGIMATRTIESRKERLATILVAPFMSCSARLPVYTLLIGAFFAMYGAIAQAGIMLGCYLLGIVAAAGTAFVFKRTLTKGPATSFILELPTYKIPQASQVLRQVWTNTKAFLTKAGTIIFCLSVILWAMAYYPRLPGGTGQDARNRWELNWLAELNAEEAQLVQTRGAKYPAMRNDEHSRREMQSVNRARALLADGSLTNEQKLDGLWAPLNPDLKPWLEDQAAKAIQAEQLQQSFSGRIGHLMEPAIRPLGYDWKIGIGLVSAFAAREVFVSSMGIVYSVGNVDDGKTGDLSAAMRADTYASGPRAGKPVWTPVVAVSLLVWFVLAMQCMSTFAIVRRETGGWRWPIFMLVYMNVLAYVVSLIVFQVGSRIFA